MVPLKRILTPGGGGKLPKFDIPVEVKVYFQDCTVLVAQHAQQNSQAQATHLATRTTMNLTKALDQYCILLS